MARTKNSPNKTDHIPTGTKDQFIKIRCTAEQKKLIEELAAADFFSKGKISTFFLRAAHYYGVMRLPKMPPGRIFSDLEILP